jgi:hypothetical protein
VLSAEPAEADALPELPIALVEALRAELTAVVAALAVELASEIDETNVVADGGETATVDATAPEGAFVVAVPLAEPPKVLT